MKKILFALALVTSFSSAGWAQNLPAYETTGTVAITFDGEQMTHHTTSNTVPNQPDRQIHTASWLILEPMIIAGINLAPDDVYVTITSRDSIKPKPGQASLQVEFSLHPETLELKSDPAPSIRFYTDGGDKTYAMTDGAFEIQSATRLEANSLAIIASAQGVMTVQTSDEITHNPEDAVEFRAEFDLQRVVNRGTVPLP